MDGIEILRKIQIKIALLTLYFSICIIAGDISPIDVITHVPVLCEESGILYCYVPAKDDLGSASLTKRPTSCVLVTKTEKNGDRFDKVKSELKALAKSS